MNTRVCEAYNIVRSWRPSWRWTKWCGLVRNNLMDTCGPVSQEKDHWRLMCFAHITYIMDNLDARASERLDLGLRLSKANDRTLGARVSDVDVVNSYVRGERCSRASSSYDGCGPRPRWTISAPSAFMHDGGAHASQVDDVDTCKYPKPWQTCKV